MNDNNLRPITTRVPRETLKQLRVAAAIQDRSIQGIVIEAIDRWLTESATENPFTRDDR